MLGGLLTVGCGTNFFWIQKSESTWKAVSGKSAREVVASKFAGYGVRNDRLR